MADLHPLQRVTLALRAWLALLAVTLVFNAAVSVPIVLSGVLRSGPFIVLAAAAALWFWRVEDGSVTIMCSATIAVGFGMRAFEVLFFGQDYTVPSRLTGASIWMFFAVTTFVFGFLNLVVIARRSANELIEVS